MREFISCEFAHIWYAPTCSTAVHCDHSDIEGSLKVVSYCLQSYGNAGIHIFCHRKGGLLEPHQN